ncbi:MAG: HAD family phosphatase [Butyrivibrio sp.]|nr:HAD family phosphatase [Butyrivibrio sp.]
MDGVIFDSERACLSCWYELGERFGLGDVEPVFKRCIGTNNAQTHDIVENAYADKMGAGIADKLLAESSKLFHEKFDGGRLPVKKGVKEILQYLKNEGIKVGVASSTRKAVVISELTDAGFIDYFDMVVGGDAVKISKPNPEIYTIACRELGVIPGDTFAIEDSYNGIRAAKAAGMRPIMVPDIIGPDNEMRELSEVICEDLPAVVGYFEKLK